MEEQSIEEHTKQLQAERIAGCVAWLKQLGDIPLPTSVGRLEGGLQFTFDDGTGMLIQFQLPLPEGVVNG